jgi:hypothetical protein
MSDDEWRTQTLALAAVYRRYVQAGTKRNVLRRKLRDHVDGYPTKHGGCLYLKTGLRRLLHVVEKDYAVAHREYYALKADYDRRYGVHAEKISTQ